MAGMSYSLTTKYGAAKGRGRIEVVPYAVDAAIPAEVHERVARQRQEAAERRADANRRRGRRRTAAA